MILTEQIDYVVIIEECVSVTNDGYTYSLILFDIEKWINRVYP